MPELTVFITDEEARALAQLAMEQQAWLIPDLDYKASEPMRIVDVLEYERFRRQKHERLFFVQRQDFVRCPLEMRPIIKKRRRIYYIDQRRGGPSIHFIVGVTFVRGATRFVGSSSISYDHTYWNTLLESNETVPMELKSFYAQLKMAVLRGAKRLMRNAVKPWISPGVATAMRHGVRLVGFENRTIADLEQAKSRK